MQARRKAPNSPLGAPGRHAVTCRCTPSDEEAGILLKACLLEDQIQIISVLVTDGNWRTLSKTRGCCVQSPAPGPAGMQQVGWDAAGGLGAAGGAVPRVGSERLRKVCP